MRLQGRPVYISYLEEFTERIQINGEHINKEELRTNYRGKST